MSFVLGFHSETLKNTFLTCKAMEISEVLVRPQIYFSKVGGPGLLQVLNQRSTLGKPKVHIKVSIKELKV